MPHLWPRWAQDSLRAKRERSARQGNCLRRVAHERRMLKAGDETASAWRESTAPRIGKRAHPTWAHFGTMQSMEVRHGAIIPLVGTMVSGIQVATNGCDGK